MKRGTTEHPKVLSLAEAIQGDLLARGSAFDLGFCQTIACGLLERLHHFTARYAPAGDVGKHSNPRIAHAIGWSFDSTWIIDQLVACRLLDSMVSGVRLYVHDWHDHSDDAADKWLAEKHLTYANGALTRRGKKSRPGRDSVAVESRQSESESESSSEPKSKPSSEPESVTGAAKQIDPALSTWLVWWNALTSDSLVPAGVNANEPSKAVLRGWERVQKSTVLRDWLADRDAVRREIAASSFCREGWFTLPKLFGGTNREGELIAERLMQGGYRDAKPKPAGRVGAGQTYDPHAAEKDPNYGKF